MENKTTVIGVKQDLSWHIASAYLENFYSLGISYRDKKFRKMLDALNKYIDEKLILPFDNLSETYVISELDCNQKRFPYGKPLVIEMRKPKQ